MPFAQNNDIRLYYDIAGSKSRPPLFLVGSIGTSHHMWDSALQFLEKDFFLVRIDKRGHGRSDAPAGDYIVADLADDVLAIADHIGLSKFSICGLSLGGIITQSLAIQSGDRLEKIIIANSSPAITPPEAWQQRADIVRSDGMAAISDMVMERFFSDRFRQRNTTEFQRIRQEFLELDPAGYSGCCTAIRDFDARESVHRITVPTLVISGTLDIATPTQGHSDLLTAAIADARLVELDAGHVSAVEVPDKFAAAVTGFMKS